MPTSTASLSLSRGGNRGNNNAATGQATAQATAPVSSSAAPPWRRTSRQESTTAPTQTASSTARKVDTSVPPPPPPPPSSMGPPPPPPPPPSMASLPPPNKEVTVKLEQIRKTPRKRPDWASMMKEIESGKKLKRVQTNDRSQPILPKSKAKGKVVHGQTLPITTCSDDTGIDGDMNTKEVFVYDSEKPTVANQILLEIQRGVRLKKAQCNDRSRPNLNGLGVFRRQLSTVDQPEQQDAAPSPLIEPEEDYDDIDKVRDDLQSTKQLLEIELKNRIKIDTENARLQNEIRRLKEELSKKPQAPSTPAPAPAPAPVQSAAPLRKSSSSLNQGLSKSTSRMLLAARKAKKAAGSDDDDDSDEEIDFGELEAVEEEMNALRGQAELARKTAEEFESRYKETSQKLVTTQAEMEDLEMKVTVLQKKLRRAQAGNGIEEAETTEIGIQTDPMKFPTPPPQPLPPSRSYSKRDMRRQMSRQDSRTSNLSSTGGGAGDSGDEDEEGEDEDPMKAQKRELKMLLSRLRSAKDKEKATANERIAMKQQLRKFRSDLKDEKKKYVQLKKEVDGMAGMMNDLGDDEKVEVVVEEIEVTDSEEEEEPEEEEEEEESEESEDEEPEEESEESEEDTESDEFDTRVDKLSERLRNHDNYLNTLKKANYLLKSKVDKWQEELRKERGRYKALEIELNTCLAELG